MAQKKIVHPESGKTEYGAPLLKRVAQRYTGMGLTLAVAFHMGGAGAYWCSHYLNKVDNNVRSVGNIRIVDIGPPPSILNQQALPQIAFSTPLAKLNVGVPVPVPDAQVSPEQTIMSQRDLSEITGPENFGNGGGDVTVLPPDLKVPDDDTPPPIFRPVEAWPQVVKQVIPKYPELAQRAGIEGRVIVKIWVDKNGAPHQAIVMKSDAEIFDQPAVDAAMQYRFTPAIMNKGPVAVWVVIPFTFKLKQR